MNSMQDKTLRTLSDIFDRKWEKIRQTRLKFNWNKSFYFRPTLFDTPFGGSGPTRPDTNSARKSTRPRVNSAGSTRPLIFPITGGVFYKNIMFLVMNNNFRMIYSGYVH